MLRVLSRLLAPTPTFRRLANGVGRVTTATTTTTTTKREMDEASLFVGREDRYNGIIVESTKEADCHGASFVDRLRESLKRWKKDEKSTIWFKVDLANAAWVPELVHQGFKFHHAKEEYVTLYRWLPSQSECSVPPYAHTNLGVGGFVYDDDTGEVLVVKDRHSVLDGRSRWKLPGGFVEPGENIPEAVMREVHEETGVRTEFESVVGFRHAHGYAFGCSDIYLVARLRPLTRAIQKCEREIQDCTWMKLEDYANDPDIVQNNRILGTALLTWVKNRAALRLIKGEHPLTKEPVSIFLFSDAKS